jgi:hypothetical protein
MPSSIELEIGGISVVLNRFTGTDLPRIPISTGQATYTATGTAIGSGVSYEPKHLWTINALCTPDECDRLQLIWIEHDRRRRALQYADIWIIDRTEEFSERLPRTRAIALGASERVFPASASTHVFYYAKFAAWMPEAPKLQQEGKYKAVELTLYESEKIAP